MTEEKPAPTPSDIGPYHILDTLGEGGMGTVYLCEQRLPVRRRVALKVIKLGMDSKAVLARFDAERQALSMMEHSCVARIYDAGISDKGQPYFAMEYVKGIPITHYCDDNKLTLDQRIELFRRVCSGVQHAHLKGVMHRDLKPGNVLVTVQDGKPVPKIIDFGLAKAMDHRLVEATLFTQQGQVIGTPEYMSPEQAGLGGLDVDTRTDVYSLGVLLYELLTGEVPFSRQELRRAGLLEMQRILKENDAPKPSTKITTLGDAAVEHARLRGLDGNTLQKRLRGDLDWIVLKALEKDRTRRYETALELAADLERHFEHLPVLASPPGLAYRVKKFTRRYRVQCAAAALVFTTIIAGAIGTYVQYLRAEGNATLAKSSETRARDNEARATTNENLANERAAENAKLASSLDRKVSEFNQLAALVFYERVIEAEEALYPPWPKHVDAMERWLRDDAGKLLAMQPDIERTVRDLEAHALPATKAESGKQPVDASATVSEPQTFRFELESQRFLHDTLADLLQKLGSLASKEDRAVRQRLSWARQIAELTLAHPKARHTWGVVRSAIAKADDVVASKLYAGCTIELRDQDVTGLVPIGMNPVTKLWEFYELRSAWDGKGDPKAIAIPEHDADGRIEVGDDTGIVFVLLPGGTFTMGAQKDDEDLANYDEHAETNEAAHEVTLAPFLLARHELTQGQWARLWSGDEGLRWPSFYKLGGDYLGIPGTVARTHPVETVSWEMCDTLMRRCGLSLPTEAQWEFGCRAGQSTPWYTGKQPSTLAGHANVLDRDAVKDFPPWGIAEAIEDGFAGPAPVGHYRGTNSFGLHDVHGNVWEWCRDWFGDYDAPCQPGDGLRLGGTSSGFRVARGGSYRLPATRARSANRSGDAPTVRDVILGCRAARALRP